MADSGQSSGSIGGVDYRLAAAGREAAEDQRLDVLEQIYDPMSRRRRALVQLGWRCLEVGAGRGSMAVWPAQQVGPLHRALLHACWGRRDDVRQAA